MTLKIYGSYILNFNVSCIIVLLNFFNLSGFYTYRGIIISSSVIQRSYSIKYKSIEIFNMNSKHIV